MTLRERSSSVTLCSAVERNDHHCVERNRELIPPDTGMFRVMDGAGDGSLWIRWRIVFSSLRAAVPFLRTWKANSGIRACPYSTKNWNKTRKKRSEHHWSSVAALFPSGTEKGLYKWGRMGYNNTRFRERAGCVCGLVAQLGEQAGQLYAPRFGGVTRMVAIRFTSAIPNLSLSPPKFHTGS